MLAPASGSLGCWWPALTGQQISPGWCRNFLRARRTVAAAAQRRTTSTQLAALAMHQKGAHSQRRAARPQPIPAAAEPECAGRWSPGCGRAAQRCILGAASCIDAEKCCRRAAFSCCPERGLPACTPKKNPVLQEFATPMHLFGAGSQLGCWARVTFYGGHRTFSPCADATRSNHAPMRRSAIAPPDVSPRHRQSRRTALLAWK